MSNKSTLPTSRGDPPKRIASHPLHFLPLLASLAGAIISPGVHADNIAQIARQHIENWNQMENPNPKVELTFSMGSSPSL